MLDENSRSFASDSTIILDAHTGEIDDADPSIGPALDVNFGATHFISRGRLHTAEDGDGWEGLEFPWAMGTKYLWSVEDDELTARRLDAVDDVVWRAPLEVAPSSPTAIAVSDDRSVVAVGCDDGRIAVFEL